MGYGAEVNTIDSVKPLEGSTKLEVVSFYNNKSIVVPIGKFKKGERALWIKPKAWVDRRMEQFKFMKRSRVKRRKILGVYSDGLVFKLDEFSLPDKYVPDADLVAITRVPNDVQDVGYPIDKQRSLALTVPQKSYHETLERQGLIEVDHNHWISMQSVFGTDQPHSLFVQPAVSLNYPNYSICLSNSLIKLRNLYNNYESFILQNEVGGTRLLITTMLDGSILIFQNNMTVTHGTKQVVRIHKPDAAWYRVTNTSFYKKLESEVKLDLPPTNAYCLRNTDLVYSGVLGNNSKGEVDFLVYSIFNTATKTLHTPESLLSDTYSYPTRRLGVRLDKSSVTGEDGGTKKMFERCHMYDALRRKYKNIKNADLWKLDQSTEDNKFITYLAMELLDNKLDKEAHDRHSGLVITGLGKHKPGIGNSQRLYYI